MSIKLDDVKDPKLRQRIEQALQAQHPGGNGPTRDPPPQTGKPKKRIRQDQKPLLNKLENEWLNEMRYHHPGAVIWSQALKWRLGNGIFYKPDFAAFVVDYPFSGAPAKVLKLTCWEVKGLHAFRGGFENLKVAASLYSTVRWILVWKDHGQWREQIVLP